MGKVLFAYFPENGLLKSVALVFDTEHLYDLDPIGKTLTISPNPNGKFEALDNAHFSLVALVGKNGAGKSTLMSLILHYLGDGNSDFLPGSVIICREENTVMVYTHDDYTLIGMEHLTRNEVKGWSRMLPNMDQSYRVGTVYITNHLDITQFNSPTPLFSQLGINLIFSPVREVFYSSSQIEPNLHDENMAKAPLIEGLERYQKVEFDRVCSWISEHSVAEYFASTGLRLPSFLCITNNYFDRRSEALETLGGSFDLPWLQKRLGGSPIEEFAGWLLISLWIYLVDESKRALNFESEYLTDLELFRQRLLEFLSEESSLRLGYSELASFFMQLASEGEFKFLRLNYRNWIEAIEELRLMDENKQIFSARGRYYVSLPIDSDDRRNQAWGVRKRLQSLFPNAKVISSKFVHGGDNNHQLSSGELTLLSLLAKLRESLHKLEGDMIMLLDEFELTLHPRWQQQIIGLIVDVIKRDPRRYNRTVQVVVSTHSPLILSDLPGAHVYRLDGGVVSQQVNSRTFGMSLYDLFHDEFFLDNSFIGALAKQEIEEIVKYLDEHFERDIKGEWNINGVDTVKSRVDRMVQRIDKIGDDFLRSSLLDRLYLKISNDIRKDLEIARLTDQINRLRDDQSAGE